MTEPTAGAAPAPEETPRVPDPAAGAPAAPPESLLAASAEEGEPTVRGDDTRPAEAPDAEAAPVSYEPFALPDGVEVDTAALEEAQSLFAEARLSQPQAQKLVDLYAGRMAELARRQIEAQVALAEDRQKAWVAEVKNDPDLGGRRFEAARAAAQRALDRFGTPELRRTLEELWVGNNPQLFRFFVRVGQAFSENDWGSARSATNGPSAAETLYPRQNRDNNKE